MAVGKIEQLTESKNQPTTPNSGAVNCYNAEIRLLKNTVKALAKMLLHYRIGKPQMPEWVFNNLDKAKKKYGDDLTKIV